MILLRARQSTPRSRTARAIITDPVSLTWCYNTAIQAPDSWKYLLSPEFFGQVGLPGVSSGSAFQFIGVLAGNVDFGWDYFRELKANGGMQFKANKDVLQWIATGEILAGPVLDYMVTDMKKQGFPVDFVIPTEGAVAVASPIAILNDCKSPELAALFIEYTLSQEGQELLVSMNTTPVRKGIETPDDVLSLDDITVMAENKEYLSGNTSEIKETFQSIFSE